ncbi:permease [Asticcacaulis sp. AC460]|uniref:LptF/LptG family permease n=1 Tax=Asticcacaulis sp. AC460 TaxID=1282360 RepID=UPI0003C3B15E|nr:LptF/LptG family permease [Asticcacaulis sp. AC460]ESQ92483.1 permease [Asticcacaulis sp. AC460]
MRTLDRYIFRQMIVPVAGAVAALTAIALISQSLTQFDLVVEYGQDAWTFIKVTLLSMPLLSGLILPIALFVGTLVALTRLQGEHEFTAAFASGMSLREASSPIIRIGVYFLLFSLASNLFMQPWSARLMREELFRAKNDLVSTMVREGEFSTSPSGLTIYVQRIDQNSLLRQIYIRTPAPEGGSDRTYVAREGKITEVDGASLLILRHGSTQWISNGELDHITFDEYSIDISPYFASDDSLTFKESERYLHELFFPNLKLPGGGGNYERKNVGKLVAEGHSRIASPLYNLTFVLLAIAAVLGGGFNRGGYTRRIAVAAGVAVTARLLGVVMQTIGAEAGILNFLQYLVPIIPIILCLRVIHKRDHTGVTIIGGTTAPHAGLRTSSADFGAPRRTRI